MNLVNYQDNTWTIYLSNKEIDQSAQKRKWRKIVKAVEFVEGDDVFLGMAVS